MACPISDRISTCHEAAFGRLGQTIALNDFTEIIQHDMPACSSKLRLFLEQSLSAVAIIGLIVLGSLDFGVS